ncbi:hypothetical protein KAE70_03195 [Bartonella henselae]|uniref:hypothetical protein n=1 Tax=Bartonella henselae TaxID=38323 RepID=UPI000AB02FA2|nr:hypothetical protein [Bartonella henselae]UJM33500.1 hypothetical protein KAE70_03195 [Bartonella henselae]
MSVNSISAVINHDESAAHQKALRDKLNPIYANILTQEYYRAVSISIKRAKVKAFETMASRNRIKRRIHISVKRFKKA